MKTEREVLSGSQSKRIMTVDKERWDDADWELTTQRGQTWLVGLGAVVAGRFLGCVVDVTV